MDRGFPSYTQAPLIPGSAILSQPGIWGAISYTQALHMGLCSPVPALGSRGSPPTPRHPHTRLCSPISVLGSGDSPPISRPLPPQHQALRSCLSPGIWEFPSYTQASPNTRLCSPVSVLGSGGSLTTPRLPPTPGSAVLYQSWDLGGSPPTPRHPPHQALQSCFSPRTWGFSSNTQAPLHWALSQS